MNHSPSFVVKLAPGIVLRDPATGRVITSGESVPRDTFWTRRLNAGDVEEVLEPEESAPTSAPAALPQITIAPTPHRRSRP